MSNNGKISKLSSLQLKENEAYKKYESTKNTSHLKLVLECLEKRDKLVTSRIKEVRS